MTDVTPTDEANTDSCGCCLPPPDAAQDKLSRLLAGRDALDLRLRQLEVASRNMAGASR